MKLIRIKSNNNKMQSEMADFTPGATTWRIRRNIPYIRVVFDSVPFPENMISSTKPEVHNV